jgi:hypothetical protein
MVEFIHGIVALLAGVILVLAATVAWLYVQQSRTMHAVNALAVAITTPPPSFMTAAASQLEPDAEPEPEPEAAEAEAAEAELESAVPAVEAPVELGTEAPAECIEVPVLSADDDRISVHEVNDAPPSDAIESVQGKTIAQLRDILKAKGIPFNKSDKKPVLISLVQISS